MSNTRVLYGGNIKLIVCLGLQAEFDYNKNFHQVVHILRVGGWYMIFSIMFNLSWDCTKNMSQIPMSNFLFCDTQAIIKAVFKGLNGSFGYIDPIIMRFN